MQRYNLVAFGGMIGPTSKIRVDAFAEALRQAITPGCTVLDIGTGPGFFAILAARFGAGHVYGIDPNPSLDLARTLAEANGVGDRCTFVRGLSTDFDIPQRADVIVSDVRGALPWMQTIVHTITDARERLLAPGGTLIPARDEVWAAVVDAPKVYDRIVGPWTDNEFGLDLSAARKRVADHAGKGHVTGDNLLVDPQLVATLDWATITDPNATANLVWTAERSGTAHGVSMWFDTELAPGIGYSNAPTEPHMPIYSQMFFPFREAVGIEVGDGIQISFRAHLVKARYVWSWSTTITSSGGDTRASFDQASFGAEPAFGVD